MLLILVGCFHLNSQSQNMLVQILEQQIDLSIISYVQLLSKGTSVFPSDLWFRLPGCSKQNFWVFQEDSSYFHFFCFLFFLLCSKRSFGVSQFTFCCFLVWFFDGTTQMSQWCFPNKQNSQGSHFWFLFSFFYTVLLTVDFRYKPEHSLCSDALTNWIKFDPNRNQINSDCEKATIYLFKEILPQVVNALVCFPTSPFPILWPEPSFFLCLVHIFSWTESLFLNSASEGPWSSFWILVKFKSTRWKLDHNSSSTWNELSTSWTYS